VSLHIEPLDLAGANFLVARWHRHHVPVQGHRFSIGIFDEDGVPHGAAIVGRPVGGGKDQAVVAEVTRLVTDGTPNACSMLYSAAARAAKAMGYTRIQTYILTEEPGTSLKASGWRYARLSHPVGWHHDGPRPARNIRDGLAGRKQLWQLPLNKEPDANSQLAAWMLENQDGGREALPGF